MMMCHIRREDEVNITECGKMTDYDVIITDAPIMVGDNDCATFPDVPVPVNYANCPTCWERYLVHA